LGPGLREPRPAMGERPAFAKSFAVRPRRGAIKPGRAFGVRKKKPPPPP